MCCPIHILGSGLSLLKPHLVWIFFFNYRSRGTLALPMSLLRSLAGLNYKITNHICLTDSPWVYPSCFPSSHAVPAKEGSGCSVRVDSFICWLSENPRHPGYLKADRLSFPRTKKLTSCFVFLCT